MLPGRSLGWRYPISLVGWRCTDSFSALDWIASVHGRD
uniref:Uncharacterized protein n=1 Tax=Setaria italica TaxID=4555 RepID=K3Y464_SETIT